MILLILSDPAFSIYLAFLQKCLGKCLFKAILQYYSYKSLLIEWCQKEKKTFDYNVYEDTGNDNMKHFSVKLSIDGKVVSKGRGTSKKKAEEKASKRAYFAFQNKINTSFKD